MPALPPGSAGVTAPRGLPAWVRRVLDARARPMDERTRRLLLAVALALFVALGAWAWAHRPAADLDTNWWLLLAALALTGPGLLLKAVEYSTAAAILGQRPRLHDALQISILSSAANLLPVPGSAIVTTRALSERGSTYGKAAGATAAVGVAWVATSLVYGGVGIAVAARHVWLASGLIAVGLVLLVATWRMIAGLAGTGRVPRLWVRTLAVETAFILISTARFWLILRAMGVAATAAQTVALTIAATLANAIGFLPSGLGIREAIAAAISPLVDLDPEAGLLMAVFDRVFWLAVLALAAAAIVLHRRDRAPRTGRSTGARGTDGQTAHDHGDDPDIPLVQPSE